MEIEFVLPAGYAPEFEPDELVWSHMKRTGTAKRPLASKRIAAGNASSRPYQYPEQSSSRPLLLQGSRCRLLLLTVSICSKPLTLQVA